MVVGSVVVVLPFTPTQIRGLMVLYLEFGT